MVRITLALFALLLSATALAQAETGPPPRPGMFGGQLVRPTTLAGAVAVEVGGGGALYATERFYWGGGGGTVFQLGDVELDSEIELFHGELMLGYDLVQSPRVLVSAMALAGVAMTKQHSGAFAISEARLAVRRPLTRWFMLGTHVAYRRVLGSDIDGVTNADLSGPILGVELYFTR